MRAPLLSRREILQTTACGFGSLALAGMASAGAGTDPLAAKRLTSSGTRARASQTVTAPAEASPTEPNGRL